MQDRIKNDIPERQASWYRIFGLLLLLSLLSACGGSGGSSSTATPDNITLSGKVGIPSDSDVDADINGTAQLNNEANDPQIINNPSTVGGYLSGYSGNYPSGNSFSDDSVDYFSAQLVETQQITLSLFQADQQFEVIDLTLRLVDESQQVVTELSMNEFSSATFTVPADGLHIIELSVSANSDPLLYTLTLSQSLSQSQKITKNSAGISSAMKDMLKQDFVTGEVLLGFKQLISHTDQSTQSLSVQSESTSARLQQTYGLTLEQSIPGIATHYRISEHVMSNAFSLVKSSSETSLDELERKLQTLAFIESLKQEQALAFVEPNYIYHSAASTDDPRLNEQWNLSMLSTQAAWQVSTGQNVVVAVLDTGIDASHEDLQENVLTSGYDFISSASSAGDGNGVDADPNDEGSSFHGSHVAGIIAAEADNAKGIAGIAYQASIMPLRVLGVQDSGNSSDIAQAILYAAGLTNSSAQLPGRAADIINMSFGGSGRSETIKLALDQAEQEGLILIAAAGNEASDTAFYPAAFDNVIGVGSVANDKSRSGFSNFGINVQLVAPGGSGSGSPQFDGFEDAVLSTISANNYRELAGTSMAAPHVSAVAALMKSLRTDLTGTQFFSAVANGDLTDNVASELNDTQNFFGAGLINAAKAVNWAAGSIIIPPVLSAYPLQFGFTSSITKADLMLDNPGSGSLEISSITPSSSWIAVSPKQINAENGLGLYELQVSLTQAPIAQGTISIAYRINNGPEQSQVLKVFLSRRNQTDSTVGVVFVSLFKEEDILSDQVQPFITVGGQLSDGVYNYCFNNVPAGRYLLAASTDNDGDQRAFDSGEASGTYPLVSRPAYIEIDEQSLRNINFDMQYPSLLNSGGVVTMISSAFKRALESTSLTEKLRDAAEDGVILDAAAKSAAFSSQSNCAN